MNLGDIYYGVLQRLGKDQFGGYQTPDNFNIVVEKVNIDAINALIEQFENERMVSRDLLPLIKTLGDPTNLPLIFDSYGYADVPDDYYYFARGQYAQILNQCGGYTENIRMVELLDQSDFGARVSTELKRPTKEYPIMVRQNDKFLIRPVVQSIGFTYVRQPSTPFFDYDIVNDAIVYLPPNSVHVNSSVLPIGTPSLSVEFEYPDTMFSELIERIVREYGISIRSEFNIQTSNPTQSE